MDYTAATVRIKHSAEKVGHFVGDAGCMVDCRWECGPGGNEGKFPCDDGLLYVAGPHFDQEHQHANVVATDLESDASVLECGYPDSCGD